MKRLWLFPLLLLIILLIAFQFRWDNGPLQKDGKYWVMYKVDRWTGHSWFYRAHIDRGLTTEIGSRALSAEAEKGNGEGSKKSGTRENESNADSNSISLTSSEVNGPTPLFLDYFVPAVNEVLLENRITQAFEDDETKQKVLEIQYGMEDANRMMEDNLQGHLEYVEVEENLRLRRTRRGPTTEQLEAHNAWFDANKTITNLNQELSSLSSQIREETAQKIRNQIIRKTKTFTLGWMVLTLVGLTTTIHYFISELKNIKRIDETFEVIEYHTRRDRERGEGSIINTTI